MSFSMKTSMKRGLRLNKIAFRQCKRFATLPSNRAKLFWHGIEDGTNNASRLVPLAAVAMFVTASYSFTHFEQAKSLSLLEASKDELLGEGEVAETRTVINWSGTHKIEVPETRFFEPESQEELEQIVKKAHESGISIRPVGSALSPNGLSFNSDGMVSMAHMDKIIEVDKEKMTVKVQAGARVSEVIEALREHDLTLPNLASIAEQQMGGFTQVGAHGTGALISPVDEFVLKMKVVTPSLGTIEVERYQSDGVTIDPLFLTMSCGLGALGIVSEITMQCIPAHKLIEHTFVISRKQAREMLPSLLKKHKHMRYMWIPYEDAVVVVTNDPVSESDVSEAELAGLTNLSSNKTREEQFEPLVDLLLEVVPNKYTRGQLMSIGFGELRDMMLAVNPLDADHIRRCNKAEAEFWRRSEGFQIQPSDKLLQFDCGGEQWVFEICFETGLNEEKNSNDIEFMETLLDRIEKGGIAAPAPIEQRWTASSSSFMSPANGCVGGLHSWIGIIMYLPSENLLQRNAITNAFKTEYCKIMRNVGKDFNATSHWAKLEMPANIEERDELRKLMREKYPVDLFNQARNTFDPKGILSNPIIQAAFDSN